MRAGAQALQAALAAAGEPARFAAGAAVGGGGGRRRRGHPLRPACLEALRLVAATNVATLSRRNALAPLLAAVVPPTENGVPR